MNTPDFLIIGIAKCGSTTIYEELKQIKEIILPEDKEPSILLKSKDKKTAQKMYQNYYKRYELKGKLKGEGSTCYSMYPAFRNIAPFAKEVCGKDLKIISILRNPVDRLLSHVNHDIAVGRIDYRLAKKLIYTENSRYRLVSDYYFQLKNWIDVFGRENLLALSIYDYGSDRISFLHRVAQFLEISVGYEFDDYPVKILNRNDDLVASWAPNYITNLYRTYIKPNIKIPRSARKIGKKIFEYKIQQKYSPANEELIFLKSIYSNQKDKLFGLLGYEINLEM